jgi:hypothetical protein
LKYHMYFTLITTCSKWNSPLLICARSAQWGDNRKPEADRPVAEFIAPVGPHRWKREVSLPSVEARWSLFRELCEPG